MQRISDDDHSFVPNKLQFPLRALFLLIVLAAPLALFARWLVRQSPDQVAAILVPLIAGLSIGLGTCLLCQLVRDIDFLSIPSKLFLIGIVAIGLGIFRNSVLSYGAGLGLGIFFYTYGLQVLNSILSSLGWISSNKSRVER